MTGLATQHFASDTLHLGRFLTLIVADEVRSLSIVTVFLLFAVALFGGFTYRLTAMVWGTPRESVKRGEGWDVGHVPLIFLSLALVGLGITLPDPIRTLLDRAVTVLLAR